MELGKRQKLKVLRVKEFGVYLGDLDLNEGMPKPSDGASEQNVESVLLPKKQVPDGTKIGDEIEVFLYKDSADRWISTTKPTKIQVGELARLEVKQTGKIGAFVDIGLERDVLIPFKEMGAQLKVGDFVLASLYVDRSHRLAATTKIYRLLKVPKGFHINDEVEGTVYAINEFGTMVAIENQYFGLIPKQEKVHLCLGDVVYARVVKIREDGKINLSLKKNIREQIQMDADLVFSKIGENGLGFSETSDKDLIMQKLGLSKSAFKRALGHLLKKGLVIITEENVLKK